MDIDSVRRLKAKIDERREQLETLKAASVGIYRLDGLPRAKAQASPTESIAASIVDAEKELGAMLDEFDDASAKLLREIVGKVKGMAARVLALRYVCCMTFSEIIDAVNLSAARVYALHSEGVKKFKEQSA